MNIKKFTAILGARRRTIVIAISSCTTTGCCTEVITSLAGRTTAGRRILITLDTLDCLMY